MKAHLKNLAISAANQLGAHRHHFHGESKLWILMYHRILPADDLRYPLEEPGMIVEPDTFGMHLREAKKHFDVLDFSEWLNLKNAGEKLPKRACVITFDDGWYDNVEFALPVIKQEQVPITLFTVVEKIGTDFQFWPNLISALLASHALPAMQSHPLFAQALAQVPDTDDTNNREYMAAVIHKLKQSSDGAIFEALDTINWRSHLAFELPRGLMNWDDVRTMQSSGLVSIGSHTCNHKRLNASLTAKDLHHEVVESKQLLATKVDRSVDIFCFPNGDYNPAALESVTETYGAAVTTKRGIVNATTADLHQLTRIGLHQHISDTPRTFGARLSGWI